MSKEKKRKKQVRREVKEIRRRSFAGMQEEIRRVAGPRVEAGVCCECGGGSTGASPEVVLHHDACQGAARLHELYKVFDTYTVAIL